MYQFKVKLDKAVMQKIKFSDLYWVMDEENPVNFLGGFLGWGFFFGVGVGDI